MAEVGARRCANARSGGVVDGGLEAQRHDLSHAGHAGHADEPGADLVLAPGIPNRRSSSTKVSNSICRAGGMGRRALRKAESLSMVSRTATSKAPRDRRIGSVTPKTFSNPRISFARSMRLRCTTLRTGQQGDVYGRGLVGDDLAVPPRAAGARGALRR